VTDYRNKREAALQRWGQLTQDRSSWIDHWRDLAHWTLPRSGRFLDTTTQASPNRGEKKNSHILDNTAQRAVGIMTASRDHSLPARLQHRFSPWPFC
jgi:hypothetical protein